MEPIAVGVERILDESIFNSDVVGACYSKCLVPRSTLELNQIDVVFVPVMVEEGMSVFMEEVRTCMFDAGVVRDNASGMVPPENLTRLEGEIREVRYARSVIFELPGERGDLFHSSSSRIRRLLRGGVLGRILARRCDQGDVRAGFRSKNQRSGQNTSRRSHR